MSRQAASENTRPSSIQMNSNYSAPSKSNGDRNSANRESIGVAKMGARHSELEDIYRDYGENIRRTGRPDRPVQARKPVLPAVTQNVHHRGSGCSCTIQ